MKSLLVSVLFPAWVWIHKPQHRFLSVANSDRLATRDAQKMKWLVESAWYRHNWQVTILKDQTAKSQFGNSKYGLRQSIGIGANVTGLRGDTQLWDDLISADDAYSDAERAAVKLAIDQKLINRLNDPDTGVIILIMQRLHEDDPTGHLLKSVAENWTLLRIPMEYEGIATYDAGSDIGQPELNDPRTIKGQILDNRTSPASLRALKERLGKNGSAGQLQQRPVPVGGGIIKTHMWKRWPLDKRLPKCQFILTSWDTAFGENDAKNNAYSAATRWGVFWHKGRNRYCVMLLGRWYGRVEYVGLRAKFDEWDKKFTPDLSLVEAKSTGITLIGDLKDVATHATVKAYSPGKGEDKISRAHSVTPVFEMELVYIPPERAWAEELIDHVAAFPNGAPPSADLTDTVTQALIYLRKSRWFENETDETLDKERERYDNDRD